MLAQTVDLLHALAGHCAAAVADHRSIIVSLFVTGLVGSLSHCTGMCGPLVAAQAAERLGGQRPGPGGEWRRLAGAALLPYQFGRATTYMALGALLALPVGLAKWGTLWWVAPLLLAVAAAVFMLQAFRGLGIALPLAAAGSGVRITATIAMGPLQRGFQRVLGLARPLFQQPRGWRGYGLGIVLGFLPCGLLYAALAAAAATGDAFAAAIGMLAFTVGTFPISWVIGFGSAIAAARWQRFFKKALPVLAILNAAALLALAFYQVMRA